MPRLDSHLVEIGAFPSRARAQAAIRAGLVSIGGNVIDKPATKVSPGDDIKVAGDIHPYVSRGGVKLEAALARFGFDPAGATCLDLGASTGGFSEVLLLGGAGLVYAVDVGRGQLHPSIRDHERVVNLEATHADQLSRDLIIDAIDFLVVDVSFVSLKRALPPALALCAPGARLVALVKPQFEVGRAGLGKGGIVHQTIENTLGVAEGMSQWLTDCGWVPHGFFESPIKGGDGNTEFLLGAVKSA